MTKVMLLGDTHGNTGFIINKVIPAAVEAGVHWIYQVGDFGYWEHTEGGAVFLNKVNAALVAAGLEIVFIQGNHDKVSRIPNNYNELLGFYPVRTSIWYAPNGTQWEIEGKSFLALGGAYSIDKQWRLKAEKENAEAQVAQQRVKYGNEYSIKHLTERAYEDNARTLWFPEEEMTNEEVNKIVASMKNVQIDVILAHDKPLASNPLVKLMPIPECLPNQRRLQTAVNALQPKLFVHGHLHAR